MGIELTLVSPESLLLIAGAVFSILFIIIIALVLRNSELLRGMVLPAHEDLVKKAHEEAQEIVWDAMEEAKKIRVSGELENLKSLAKEKLEVGKIEEEYEKSLEALTAKTARSLEKYHREIENELKKVGALAKTEIEKQTPAIKSEMGEAKTGIHDAHELLEKSLRETGSLYAEFASSLQEMAREQFEKDRLKIQKEYSQIPEKLETAITRLQEEGKKIIETRFDEEFKKTHGLIAEYRNNYFAFLDTAIVTLLEETTAIVLKKKLSLKDHADLVLNALEEAKGRGIFALTEKQKK